MEWKLVDDAPAPKFDTVVQLDSRKFFADARRLERDYETCKFDKKKLKLVGVKSSWRWEKRNKKHRLQQKLANAQQELEAVKEELARTRAELNKAQEHISYFEEVESSNQEWEESATVPTLQEVQEISRKMAEASHEATIDYRKHAAAEIAQQSAR
jgi:predicted nuclease with TOPRIM domain